MSRFVSHLKTIKNRKKPNKEPIKLTIDIPGSFELVDRKIKLEGWIISEDGKPLKSIRVWDGLEYLSPKNTIQRPDVAKLIKHIPKKSALNSGFAFEFEYKDQEVWLEADFGNGFKRIKTLQFSLDKNTASSNYNPFLATNWANHIDLLEAKQSYYHEDPQEQKLQRGKRSPKVIAIYLPQFYPIPENDEAWGKGFTEWTNVAAAKPRLVGHRQPILPADLGFYDLRLDDVMKEQISLAKKHGIYGFCFYYYWFSGKKVLDMPINKFLKHKDWDFKFMICWANHNWTKRWDGRDQEVIFEQKYTKDDPLNFIKDVEQILLDPRYTRVDNKPVLMVYHPKLIDARSYTKIWRDYFKKKHNLGLHLVTVWATETTDPTTLGFDAAMEFIPGALGYRSDFAEKYVIKKEVTDTKLLDIRQTSAVIDYRRLGQDTRSDIASKSPNKYPHYRCVIPSWDNDARKKGNESTIFTYDNPDLYYQWLMQAIDAPNNENGFTFINAWNEWAEGAILEPTTHYGHALLNRTGDAIAKRIPTFQGMATSPSKVAAVIQVNDIEHFIKNENYIRNLNNVEIDTYIILKKNSESWRAKIERILPGAYTLIVPARGGDVLPFLFVLTRAELLGYKSIVRLVIDSKTKFDSTLFSSSELVGTLINQTETPSAFFGINKNEEDLGSEAQIEKDTKTIIKRIYGNSASNRSTQNLSANCFWSNMELLRPIAQYGFMPDDFPADIINSHTKVEKAFNDCIIYAFCHSSSNKYRVKGNDFERIMN